MKKLFTIVLFLFSLQMMAQHNFQCPILASTDDADESVEDNLLVNPGDMDLTNTELEMIYDDNVLKLCHLTSGMRFTNVVVPQGATIVNAYIQFTCKQTGSDVVHLIFNGQKSNNTSTFTSASFDISARVKTTASVTWDPLGWYTADQAGADQRTPNLASIVQEVVSSPGWVSGNSMVFIVTGSGSSRSAYAYDADPTKVAVLHIQFSPVGIAEYSEKTDATITPNPVSDKFTLTLNSTTHQSVSFKIFNQLGAELNVAGFVDNNDGSYSFDSSGLQPGLYFLNVKTENDNIVKKFIVI